MPTNFPPHRHRCSRQVEEEKAHVRELEALKRALEGEAEDLQNQVYAHETPASTDGYGTRFSPPRHETARKCCSVLAN